MLEYITKREYFSNEIKMAFVCIVGYVSRKVDWYVTKKKRGSLNKFPDFFRMGTFIESTHMKL